GEPGGKSVRHYFVFAVLATLLFGIAAALRKVGITLIPSLSVGLCASAIGSLVIIAFWYPFLPSEDRLRFNRRSARFFLTAGVVNSLAHLAYFAALQRGPLSTVAPLVYTTPFFALAYSRLLFREVERLNRRLLAGALLICAGAALVTISRG
ncbi:MAG: EamA family transporter, partial [Nitrospinota bacterium]